MNQALAALRVVPTHAKRRVVLLVLGFVLLLIFPWTLWPHHRLLWATIELGPTFALAVFLWCRVPLGLWLVPADLHGHLPSPSAAPLVLTFDDGPTDGLTDLVLDRLAAHGVRASFFVLLEKARQNPQVIRRIVQEGHLLGLHGEDHRLPLWHSRKSLRESLLRARQGLEQIAGEPIALYRPSHGVRTPALLAALRDVGLRLCMWDHGVWDTDAPDHAVLLARMQTVRKLGKRSGRARVLLLHDGRGDDPQVPPHAGSLLAALAEFLPTLGQPASPDLATTGEQLGLRLVDQPDLTEVRDDVAQIGHLASPGQPRHALDLGRSDALAERPTLGGNL